MKQALILIASILILTVLSIPFAEADVAFVPGDGTIDVTINGSPVTTYRYGPDLAKPILYPVFTPQGVRVTRAWPLEEVEGESTDHPHHTGMFFTVDEVNGNRFWGNTKGLPHIRHVETSAMKAGKNKGVLSVVHQWIGAVGTTLLEERRIMTFIPGADGYAVDFNITLTAVDTTVVFGDTKEGMFAIRVAPWLREQDGNGHYYSARGGTSAAEIWGRRSEWVALEGAKDGCIAGVAILNHPSSINYPTYWHARNYGLFSANPLGQAAFQNGTGNDNPVPFNLTLDKGESALFRFMLIIYDGPKTPEDMGKRFSDYRNRQ